LIEMIELSEFEFCAGLAEDERAILASIIEPLDLNPDQYLFRGGEPATACFLVERGLISLEICAPGVGCRRMITVGPGELVGWSPLVADACYTATARAVQPSRLLKIPGDRLRAACEANPLFGYHVMQCVVRVLSARINASRLQLLDLFGPEGGLGALASQALPPTADGEDQSDQGDGASDARN
jgi:CRP/FNR family transcriptional regulator, cyclic AMP receptor protein